MSRTAESQPGSVRWLHARAMEHAWDAIIARQNGQQSITSSRKALGYERQAAELLSATDAPEPSRSVIHRSAAQLAYDCGEYAEANRMIDRALAGIPPTAIAAELRRLQERVRIVSSPSEGAIERSKGEDLPISKV